jgi:acyl-ACP thioesterase
MEGCSMKWIEHYNIDSHDLDFNGVARASALIRYMQEAANSQLYHCGPSGETLRADGKAFLVSRFSAGFYTKISAYERIEVQTWGCESRGFSFNRCYRVLREGEIVAEASSVWALIDIETRHPLRVTEFAPGFTTEEMLALDVPPRIVFPKNETLRIVGDHTVSYGELDVNMHMNNTRYTDMLCDKIDMTDKRIYRLSINFINEAKYRDSVNIYTATQRDDIYFKTVRTDGKTNVEAQITLGDL